MPPHYSLNKRGSVETSTTSLKLAAYCAQGLTVMDISKWTATTFEEAYYKL